MCKKFLLCLLLPVLTVLELFAKLMAWIGEHVIIESRPMTSRDRRRIIRFEAMHMRHPWS